MGEQKNSTCLICDGPAQDFMALAIKGMAEYITTWTCESCGQVACDHILVMHELRELPPDDKARLAAFVRERAIAGNKKLTLLHSIPDADEPIPNAVRLKDALEIMRRVFDSPMERINRTLLNIGRMTTRPGDLVEIDHPAVAYAESTSVAKFLLTALRKAGHIEWPTRMNAPDKRGVTLTMQGYNRIAELQAERRGIDSDQAFVAMWFADDLAEAYEKGFKAAIDDTGYKPIRLDASQQLGDIDEQIVAEIRKSRFVVADFTGHREGVYFEAGLAMGIGIPVIMTVRKDCEKDFHFDARQYRHIDWETPEALRKRLRLSIEANIPRAPHK